MTYTKTYAVWEPSFKVYSIDERVEPCDMCTNKPLWLLVQDGLVLNLCHDCQMKLTR